MAETPFLAHYITKRKFAGIDVEIIYDEDIDLNRIKIISDKKKMCGEKGIEIFYSTIAHTAVQKEKPDADISTNNLSDMDYLTQVSVLGTVTEIKPEEAGENYMDDFFTVLSMETFTKVIGEAADIDANTY